MNQIIIDQSNVYLAGLILILIVIGFFTLVVALIAFDYYRVSKSFDLISCLFTVLLTALFIASFNWFVKQGIENERFRKDSNEVVRYYNLKKDRALIVANKKSSAPDWLADQVKVKIIDENDSSYQVQSKDKFAEISKKDVK